MLFVSVGAFASLFLVGVIWSQRRDAERHRLRAEEVARAHELFRVLLEGVDIGITVEDKGGALVYANEAAAKTLGYQSPESLVGAPASEILGRFEVFHFDGTPFALDELPSRYALQGTATQEIPIRFRVRGRTEERWSLVRSVPARNRAGDVVAALNFFREVTERVREEHQRAFLLRAGDELSSSLDYESTLSAVARLAVPVLADWCAVDLVEGGRKRRIASSHVDPAKVEAAGELERHELTALEGTTGISEIVRTGNPEFVPEIRTDTHRASAHDQALLALLDQLQVRSYIGVPLVARGETIGAISFGMRESGRRHTRADLDFAQALADRAALAIENGRFFREVEKARAATATKLVAETQKRRDAEEASRFAETFIGILGHDLRNPLNAITMAGHLVKRKGYVADAKSIDRILASTLRMSNMVDQLLDLTRARLAGGIPVERRSTDLVLIAGAIVDEMRITHPDRDIRWEKCDVARGSWDQDRLAQVLSNLVGNALEHGEPTRPITVRISSKGDLVGIAVHNHGPPIPPELLSVIFEPYRRVTVRSERSKGLGLGLFIAQQIVLAHGGHMEAHSTPEEGTTFSVTLPSRVETHSLAEQLSAG
jgi:PAS domain S-box-containing protein